MPEHRGLRDLAGRPVVNDRDHRIVRLPDGSEILTCQITERDDTLQLRREQYIQQLLERQKYEDQSKAGENVIRTATVAFIVVVVGIILLITVLFIIDQYWK